FGLFLERAERVVAPSNAAAGAIHAYFPAVHPEIWPFPDEAGRALARHVRVIVPGAISVEKGLGVLEACVRDAAARDLPLHFRVVGFLGRPLPLWPEAPLTMTGQYPEGRLPQLLAIERGDVAFFPAQCPETFSYTLSAVLAAGMPVVATDLGALPERLAGRANAHVVSWQARACDMNDALIAAAQPHATGPQYPGTVTVAAYRERYLDGLRRRAPSIAPPAIQSHWTREPRANAVHRPMAWLFEDGVLAGRWGSLAELRRRSIEADAQRPVVDDTLAVELRRRLDESESNARDALAQLDRFKSSRSWRLLNAANGFVRRLGLRRK
ncbi:MAG TPA: glycosyltransferase, partial [Usitatibacter sp.]